MSPVLDSDRRVAMLATRQHGVVSRDQLRRLGLGDRAISRRLTAGRIIALHRGVYAVGHTALSDRGRWLAAVLAAGPAALLSHHSAAALWEMRRHPRAPIRVTARTWAGLEAPAGVRLHRYRSLVDADVTERDGIAVSTPARTLLDLAGELPPRALRRTVDEADRLGVLDLPDLHRLLEAHPRRRGARRLRSLVADYATPVALTRSELEERFLALCERHGLPRPDVNQRVAGLEVDFHWPAASLVVETDGFAFHRTRGAFERDRERDATLAAAGVRVQRFTHRQVTAAPDTVAAALRRSLSISGRGAAGSRQSRGSLRA